jgi:hypothetical protein
MHTLPRMRPVPTSLPSSVCLSNDYVYIRRLGIPLFVEYLSTIRAFASLWNKNPRGTLYTQKLALTSPTSGGRSVGIVRLRTNAMEYVCM